MAATAFMPSGAFGPGKASLFVQPVPIMSGAGRFVATPQGPHGIPHGAILRGLSADRAPSPAPLSQMQPVAIGTYPAGPPPGAAIFRTPSLDGPHSRAASPAPRAMGTFPPVVPVGSSMRAPSREGTAPGSRGASPGRQVLIPVQVAVAPMAPIVSPQMVQRSGSAGPGALHPIESSHGGSFSLMPPRQGARPASRSPPPQRGNARALSTPRLPMEPIAMGGMGPPAPANTPRMMYPAAVQGSVQAPMMPMSLQQVRAVATMGGTPGTPNSGRAHSVAPSPQGALFMMHTPMHSEAVRRLSMPSAGPVATTPGIQVPPFMTMEAAAQPPWAQVVRPPTRPTAREQEQQERDRKLLQTILSEVRTMSQCLADGSGPVDGESQNLDMHDLKDKLEAKDKKLLELNSELQKALQELTSKESVICSFEQDVKTVQTSKEQLEADVKRRSDAKDEAAERIAQRCADHERRNAELMNRLAEKETKLSTLQAEKERAEAGHREAMTKLKDAEDARKRLEGERRGLEVELSRLQEQAERHHSIEQETRELRCRVAVLEDTLRDTEDKQRLAERQLEAANRLRQTAEQDASSLREKLMQEEKKTAPNHQRAVWEAEDALVREQNAGCLRSPGDFLRVMNYFANRENLAYENDRLQIELFDLQQQNRELKTLLQRSAAGA